METQQATRNTQAPEWITVYFAAEDIWHPKEQAWLRGSQVAGPFATIEQARQARDTATLEGRQGVYVIEHSADPLFAPQEWIELQGKQKSRKRLRHPRDTRSPLQAPIRAPRYCITYLDDGCKRRTPWFHSQEKAQRALEVVQARVGERNATILMD